MRSVRLFLPVALLAALPQLGGAAPPTLTLPAEVRPAGDYAVMVPTGDAVAVVYVGLSGADPFPSTLLKDPRAFVLPIRGLKDGRYAFAAVASSKDGEQSRTDFVVVVGAGGTSPPPVVPPVDPPPRPVVGLYLAVVRPNGPATPEFTRVMGDPAWDGLRKAGHTVRDFTFAEACAAGFCPPAGTVLPALVTLRSSVDGKSATIVRGFVGLPTTSEGINRLPEGVK